MHRGNQTQTGRANDQSCLSTSRRSQTYKAQGAQWLTQGPLDSHTFLNLRRSMQARSAPSELKTGGPTPCSVEALQNTTATLDMNAGLSVADPCDEATRSRPLKSWSASERRTGGKAVPIKEHVRTRRICRRSALSDDIMLYQRCGTAASRGEY